MRGTETATPILTVGSLFSGIGGLELGLERNNAQTRFQVEIDGTCRKVLEHHWPDVTRLEDVTDAGRSNLPAVDVLTGGFPCQDLSVAGRRAGLAGERSGLWWQFHRIIDELRPAWVIIENVPGLLSSNRGRDMGTVLGSLADLGYWWAYRVLDAQYAGVAQRRRRVFIVGHSGDRAAPAKVLLESDRRAWNPPPRREAGQDVAGTLGSNAQGGFRSTDLDQQGAFIPTISHAVTTHQVKGGDPTTDNYVSHTLSSNGADASEDGTGRGTPLVSFSNRAMVADDITETVRADSNGALPMVADALAVRRLTPTECLRLQGFPDHWLDLDPPLNDSAKYRMVGNAVCANVAEWIGRRITEYEAST